jgi:hypothetical protein
MLLTATGVAAANVLVFMCTVKAEYNGVDLQVCGIRLPIQQQGRRYHLDINRYGL